MELSYCFEATIKKRRALACLHQMNTRQKGHLKQYFNIKHGMAPPKKKRKKKLLSWGSVKLVDSPVWETNDCVHGNDCDEVKLSQVIVVQLVVGSGSVPSLIAIFSASAMKSVKIAIHKEKT